MPALLLEDIVIPSLKIFKAKQGRMVNALALSGEEGRGKLR